MKPQISYWKHLPEELAGLGLATRACEAGRDTHIAIDLDAIHHDSVVHDVDTALGDRAVQPRCPLDRNFPLADELATEPKATLVFYSDQSRHLLDRLPLQGRYEFFNRSAGLPEWAVEKAMQHLLDETTIMAGPDLTNEAILHSIDDLIFVLSTDGRVLWYHRPSNLPSIIDPVDAIGQPVHSLPLPDTLLQGIDQALTIAQSAPARIKEQGQAFEVTLTDGHRKRTFSFRASLQEDERGLNRITFAGREITDLVEARTSLSDLTEELENSFLRAFELAFTDQTTGMPNKAALMQTLEMTMENHGDEGLALLLLHVRNLSNIRNSTRFDTGNQILKTLADRLKNEANRQTFFARYGEDEFAIFIPARMAAQESARLLKLMEAPVKTDNMEFTISCTAGMAFFPEDATSMEPLVQSAEIALREASETGVEKVRTFSRDDHRRLTFSMLVETELLKPNVTDEMHLVYQPIVDTVTRKIRYFEVLLRWNSPTLAVVPPDLFIPVAEKIGVIISLTDWMISQCSRVLHHLPEDICFSVNLSPVHLLVPTLVDDIVTLIRRHAMRPERYKIEITEGVFIRDPVEATQRIRGLKDQGFTIALDDFGVGFSGLSYLGLLPVDSIKIDRSFLEQYPEDRRSAALVEAILTLTSSFNIESIAEGVEREDQIEHLKRLGCTMLQGFLLSHPLEESDMLALFSKHR